MKAGLVALVIAALALAGCAAPSTGPAGAVPLPEATSPGATARVDLHGCRETGASVAVPLDEDRRAMIPPGYEPESAFAPLDPPGYETIAVLPRVAECTGGSVGAIRLGPLRLAGVGIPVCPPPEHRRPGPECSDHVLLRLWSDEPTLAAVLAAWGLGGAGEATAEWTGVAEPLAAAAHGSDGRVAIEVTAGAKGAPIPEAVNAREDSNRWFAFAGTNVTGYVDANRTLDPLVVGWFSGAAAVVDDADGLFTASGKGVGFYLASELTLEYHPIVA